ncbi:MAG: HU family DNA-binding protein [Solobacterium sp.]|jgi:DNA-binding protein HU-beta|nr:HU family DNA-binding protein [Solobacterium sp.]MBQ8068290.1 HU family DNA-binding protein [Solobacterium sp.]
MEAVNKKVIAETVAEKHNLTKKESAEIVDLVFDTVADALKDGAKVDIAGFGKFEVKTRAARTGINPQTKETIEIPSSKVPGFKASKSLKDLVR